MDGLRRKPIAGIIISGSIATALYILVLWGMIPFTDVSPAIAYIMLASIVGVLYWAFKEKLDVFFHNRRTSVYGTLDPRFAHLTVHYAKRIKKVSSLRNLSPAYVTNNRTKQAYQVSTFIDLNRLAIGYHSYDGIDELLKKLKVEYTINKHDSTPEDLGLESLPIF